ncbi:FAD-binding domain-containing protein [Gloeopeniophorella convolvens]|nr:FAD-binding domain-containing protein [Gloeopeniophorella convolvens]
MLRAGLVGLAFSLPLLALSSPDSAAERRAPVDYLATCRNISAAISNKSQVFFPLALQYIADNAHFATSSSDLSACSVEPGTPEDVSVIVSLPGGGHSLNPGFSSTKGVQISMTRFNQVTVNSSAGTVDVGSGLTWDQVYEALDGTGINVVGGRVPGVGVAGFTLGGGYSWLSSQFGLTIDNIAAYQLVLPNGTITTVTKEDEDLFFAIRGIVTRFTLVSHPQGEVWGGLIIYGAIEIDAVKAAISTFLQADDPKAALLVNFNFIPPGPLFITVLVFYDGPTPPPGIFDGFMSIPRLQFGVSSGSFVDFIKGLPASDPLSGTRGRFNAISFPSYPESVIDAFINETTTWGEKLTGLDLGLFLSYTLEPFDQGLLTHGPPSAYPADRSIFAQPSDIYFAWGDPANDDVMTDALHQTTAALHAAGLAQGEDLSDVPVYPNYALADTPLENMFGANIPRLQALRKEYDPADVMVLAGGFRF